MTTQNCQKLCPGLSLLGLMGMVFIFSLTVPTHAVYGARSADELLEKTMTDLQTAMDKARRGNAEFTAQNENLQDNIDNIQETIAQLQNDRDDLKREALRLTDEITLTDKENSIYQQRLKNLNTRKSRLQEENGRLEKMIQSIQTDNQKAQESLGPLREEVSRTTSRLSPKKEIRNQSLKEKNLQDLERRLAKAQEIFKKITQEKNAVQEENSSLEDHIAVSEEKLTKGQDKRTNREMNAANSRASGSQQQLRRENEELQDYVVELRESLAQLRRASNAVKPKSEIQIKNIERSLKQLQQQHVLLKKQLRRISPPGAYSSQDMSQDYDNLLKQKKSLAQAQMQLKNKILKSQQEKKSSASVSASSKGQNLQSELNASKKRVAALQSQTPAPINLAKSGSTKLSTQVDALEKQLQKLRDEQKAFQSSQLSSTTQDSGKLKEALSQLEARRAILANSLKSISSKYNLDELTSPQRGPGTQADQLKEYLQVLRNENAALQEKLLTLQMKQDKDLPANP